MMLPAIPWMLTWRNIDIALRFLSSHLFCNYLSWSKCTGHKMLHFFFTTFVENTVCSDEYRNIYLHVMCPLLSKTGTQKFL